MKESYIPKPTVKMIQHIADYRSLLDPEVEELHHHSQPWCFRFTYNKSTCKAEMHYKYPSPDAWTPNGAGLVLLKVCITLVQCNYYLSHHLHVVTVCRFTSICAWTIHSVLSMICVPFLAQFGTQSPIGTRVPN